MILKPRISGDVAYKRKWEFFASIIALGSGMLLYLITIAIPNYSTDIIYQALPLILQSFFASINDTSINNPYYPISIFFIAYIDFPSCLAWIFPGFLIGYYRNKQFRNIEIKNNGWNVFWHGMYFLQAIFMIFALGLGITFGLQFIPGLGANELLISYFGSGIVKIALFFLSPFFWIGLLLAGIGGMIGKRLAVDKAVKGEVVVEEVEAEEVFNEEEIKTITEEISKTEDEILWPEDAKQKGKVSDDDFGIAEVNIDRLKEKILSSAEESKPEFIKCQCGKELPVGAKFCNNCGAKIMR
ncbi:MAG: zinc ribbon domain-containing protein [Promethearchaeota archaeon]